jgi:Tfp pilus assembly protein PilF
MGAAEALSAAERALAGGDAARALHLLAGLHDPAALHLRAVAYRRAGRLEEARRGFAAALAAAPRDASVANNFANLLRQMGASDEALRHYDRALALRPDYRDAAFNKALLLAAMGDARGALALLDRLTTAQPGDARAHSARGGALRQLGRHAKAAQAFDAALRAEPELASALKGRAQVALERGECDAAARYRRAVKADPADLGALHGYAEALEAEGSEEATTFLERALAMRPDWIEGHELLARMKAERGDDDGTRLMRGAAARDPGNRALAVALAKTLAAADRWEEALAALPLSDDADLALMRASWLSEAGRPADALALLGKQSSASQAGAIPEARTRLRLGDVLGAARVLERAVAADSSAIAAWGLLEIAWRLLGDPRAQWLSEGLISVRDLGMDDGMLAELHATLGQLHRTRAHPIGQSLRGGTQTRGALLLRSEPVLARLREALTAAVADYVAALPAADDAHPLLRHRTRKLAIGGSWSVRLAGSGFHVSHIHPEGVISSAFYVALPDAVAASPDHAGWLELGRPPAELGLALDPLAIIEPRVGRLALFPSYLFHGTRPFADGERLTVAFDVVPA